MPNVSINGHKLNVAAGRTILETARDAGITTPILCYHRDLSVAGS
jgi:NADH dehydrogenase/NADH:ubiquinone oxidoreductase subunit G